jgi:methoxymalonate biosynthesis acyl carrier protein
MTTDQATAPAPAAGAIQEALLSFLKQNIKAEVAPDQDLFRSGVVSSMFAMQLVVHLEETYDIAIIGGDLKLDSFRTVEAMTSLVLRLRDRTGAGHDG